MIKINYQSKLLNRIIFLILIGLGVLFLIIFLIPVEQKTTNTSINQQQNYLVIEKTLKIATKSANLNFKKTSVIPIKVKTSPTPSSTPAPTFTASAPSPMPQVTTPLPVSTPQVQTDNVNVSITGTSIFTISLPQNSNQCDVLTKSLEQGKISSLNMRFDQNLGSYGVYQINNIGKENAVFWTYLVNGKSPSLGCSYIKVYDNDNVEWRYIGS